MTTDFQMYTQPQKLEEAKPKRDFEFYGSEYAIIMEDVPYKNAIRLILFQREVGSDERDLQDIWEYSRDKMWAFRKHFNERQRDLLCDLQYITRGDSSPATHGWIKPKGRVSAFTCALRELNERKPDGD